MVALTGWDLDVDIVGLLTLVELDCDGGIIRFVLGDEADFVADDGTVWIGSKLLSVGAVDFSINGDAPAMNISFSYTVDPDIADLVQLARSYGVAAVRDRPCSIYQQYLGSFGEISGGAALVELPRVLVTRRRMKTLSYVINGPSVRAVSVGVEGPFDLRSKPVNGRYTDADQQRRHPGDLFLEFVPNNNFDETPLFGL